MEEFFKEDYESFYKNEKSFQEYLQDTLELFQKERDKRTDISIELIDEGIKTLKKLLIKSVDNADDG